MNQNMQLKIHSKIIAGLQGIISGGISVEDFSAVTKLNVIDSEIILDEFIKNDIGTKHDNSYYFEDGDKLKIAVTLLENGFPIDEISVALDWKYSVRRSTKWKSRCILLYNFTRQIRKLSGKRGITSF